MKKKLISMLLVSAMTASLLAGCGSSSADSGEAAVTDAVSEGGTTEAAVTATDGSYTPGDFSGVEISMLNTKSEIQDFLEDAAEVWGESTGATLEVYTIDSSGSPSEEIATKYAAGSAPALIMGDPQDVYSICLEKGVDLSDQPWVEIGGSQYGINKDGKVYSFPFCIEGRGLIYNADAIEAITGEAFDPTAYTSMDDFKGLLDTLVAGGMEYPVAVNCEDWSLAGHFMTQVYEEQDGANKDSNPLVDELYAGTADLNNNAIFTRLFDTFDVLKQYNLNQKDPMTADRSETGYDLVEGNIAFWFDGNWAWDCCSDEYTDQNLGIMPVPANGDDSGFLCGSPTKQVMIDAQDSTEEQQAAAKDFLNWLIYTEEGQDIMVNQCSMVPAFSNIDIEATNPLARSVQTYANDGKLYDGYINYPGDHWQKVGSLMQQYLTDNIDRAGFAKGIQDYWAALQK